MNVLAVVFSLALVSGCGTHAQAKRTRNVGSSLVIGGLVLGTATAIKAIDVGYPERITFAVVGGLATVAVLVTGIALWSNGATAMTLHEDPAVLEKRQATLRAAEDAAARDRRTAPRAEAWKLTKIAAASSRSDDCATTKRIDAEVVALDAEFHAKVFRADVAIARCLVHAAAPIQVD